MFHEFSLRTDDHDPTGARCELVENFLRSAALHAYCRLYSEDG
jgi:hypothetical protein